MINVDDLIGVTYKPGGRNIYEGFDCYGLAIEVSRRFGHILPDFEEAKAIDYDFNNCKKICLNLTKNLKAIPFPEHEGDLILFKDSKGVMFHIGVYLGNGQYIHCNKLRVHVDKIKNTNDIGGVYSWQ